MSNPPIICLRYFVYNLFAKSHNFTCSKENNDELFIVDVAIALEHDNYYKGNRSIKLHIDHRNQQIYHWDHCLQLGLACRKVIESKTINYLKSVTLKSLGVEASHVWSMHSPSCFHVCSLYEIKTILLYVHLAMWVPIEGGEC